MTENVSRRNIHFPVATIGLALLALTLGGCTQTGSQGPTTIPATAFIRSGAPVAHRASALPATPARVAALPPQNVLMANPGLPATTAMPDGCYREMNIPAAYIFSHSVVPHLVR